MRPRSTTTALITIVLVTGALAACGDDDDDSAESAPATATQATETAAPENAAPATAGAIDTQPAVSPSPATAPAAKAAAATSPPTASDDATCPEAANLAAAYGGEVALDEASAMTGAVGLVFCPYNQVLAPGTTNELYGYEAIPDSFSITFTDQDITAGAAGEPVEGLGEQAFWGGDELSVWTGERGIIVSMIDPPNDPKSTAIALAQAVS